VINDVIMSDADCTPGREPRSVADSYYYRLHVLVIVAKTVEFLFKINNGLIQIPPSYTLQMAK